MRPNPRSPNRMNSPQIHTPALPLFKPGDEVEVTSNEPGLRGSWFEAKVLHPSAKNNRYTVVYDALVDAQDESRMLQEKIPAANIRPRPPRGSGPFSLNQLVDAFHNDAWWPGVVSSVKEGEDGRFMVRFPESREENEYGVEEMRMHMDWVGGEWVLPDELQIVETEFTKGTVVEVSSDDDGFRGAWYTATIIESVGKEFRVEYQHLIDDKEELLKETTDILHIRPIPPLTPVVEEFKYFEEIDAFYNDGWWVGMISKVLNGPRYIVYFRSTKEEIEFGHQELRPHYDWIGGSWLRASLALD